MVLLWCYRGDGVLVVVVVVFWWSWSFCRVVIVLELLCCLIGVSKARGKTLGVSMPLHPSKKPLKIGKFRNQDLPETDSEFTPENGWFGVDRFL